MVETMREAHGVGLAAQQVGRALQLAVIDVRGVTDRHSELWIDGHSFFHEFEFKIVLTGIVIFSSFDIIFIRLR